MQLLIKAGWQDTSLELQDLALKVSTIFMVSATDTPTLVATRISHFLLHFQVFNPLNKWLKTSVHISLQLWIHATKVLPHNPHLRLERSVHLKNVEIFFLFEKIFPGSI